MKILIVLFLPAIICGKSTSIKAELDTTKVFIGDPINWRIVVKPSKNERVEFPELNIENDVIDIISSKQIQDQNSGAQIGLEFEISAWDTGQFQTPSYSIKIFNDSKTGSYNLEVEPIYFSVLSILDNLNISEFQDIKSPVPVEPLFPLKTFLQVTALIIIFVLILLILKKRDKPKIVKANYGYMEDPKERAMKRLRNLDSSVLTKEYYFQLSHIIREFLEYKFFIRTLEMTTDEIISSREIFPINDDVFLDLVQFLSEADEVKYARVVPDTAKIRIHKNTIETFIDIL